MNPAPPNSRNAPCPCGSGKRYKQCHGLERSTGSHADDGHPHTDFSWALARHQAGLLPEAISAYRHLIEREPTHASALHYLGVALYQSGRLEEARESIEAALRINPSEPQAANNLGLVLAALGDDEGAMQRYREALELDPGNAMAWNNRGLISSSRQDYLAAIADFDRAVQCNDRFDQAMVNRGFAYLALGQPETALMSFEHAARLNSSRFDTLAGYGKAQLALRRFPGACETLSQASRLNPDHPGVLVDLAVALTHAHRMDEAVAAASKGVAIQPESPDAQLCLSTILYLVGKFQQALMHCDIALKIQPLNCRALRQRSRCLQDLGRLDEALALLDELVRIEEQEDVDTLCIRADIHVLRGDIEAAKSVLARIDSAERLHPPLEYHLIQARIAQEEHRWSDGLAHCESAYWTAPDDPKARYRLAEHLLMMGDTSRGWPLYESRRDLKENPPFAYQHAWDGKGNKVNLLVWAEQGLGDQIMFTRMLPCVMERVLPAGGTVAVAVNERLRDLYARGFPELECLPMTADLQTSKFSHQVSIASLPYLLDYGYPEIQGAPFRPLRADAHKVLELRHRLFRQGKKLCGLSWGSKAVRTGGKRSLMLENLIPLLSMSGFDFVDLQYLDSSEDRHRLATEHGLTVNKVDEIDNYNDMDGLAALMQACDLVISIDNTNAHLAAALGRPTWILLPYAADYRWMTEKEDTPWYPSVRLFRQDVPGDWEGVVGRICQALHGWVPETAGTVGA